jgi:CHAT domain-containing protein
MKKLACVLLLSCSATLACNGKDPFDPKKGDARLVGPRLSNAAWQPCCRKSAIETSCVKTPTNREDALALLVVAHERCLDRAIATVQRRSPDDMAAAYFIRGQRRNDAVDFLRALEAAEETLRRDPSSAAAMFNRALVQEKLGLAKEAIQSWDEVVKHDSSAWADEARQRRDRLMALPDPADRWRPAELEDALRRRDRAAMKAIARAFPSDALTFFEQSVLPDLEGSRMFADVVVERDRPYAQAIIAAVDATTDRQALEEGLRAFRHARRLQNDFELAKAAHAYERAAGLLDRATNPLALTARYGMASCGFVPGHDSFSLLDEIGPIAQKRGYHKLLARIQRLRANALELDRHNYFEALDVYKEALALARQDPTDLVATLNRRSSNYAVIGDPEEAFRDSYRAVTLLSGVANLNERHQAYGSAARAAARLGYLPVALHYGTAAVDAMQKAVVNASRDEIKLAKLHYGIASRARADIYLALGRDEDAAADLEEATRLAEAAEQKDLWLLQMRLDEVRAQLLMKSDPAKAAAELTKAIELARGQDSTYLAVLHFKRAAALRTVSAEKADQDIVAAFRILRDEAKLLRVTAKRGDYEQLWTPYFARFEALNHELIERRIAADDVEGAFVQLEQARGFEPMQLILQSRSVPPGFRKIETSDDLRRQLAALPDDTVILQFLVLDDKTYTWVLSRDRIRLVAQRVGRAHIEKWVADIQDAVGTGRPSAFTTAMRAAYTELFRAPLADRGAVNRPRLVIVPDGPMHSLPFAGLEGSRDEGRLIERRSIAVAGSTSLYFYALARDRQFSMDPSANVLIAGNPTSNLGPLPYSEEEAKQLAIEYPHAQLLIRADATSAKFLELAKRATIIHFSGHGFADPESPWKSNLVLAPRGNDSGVLSAETLMSQLSELERTRLVVLAACSSAAGQPVGPEGIAALVRPLIAANVPGVVGTLWEVPDATAKKLMVSLHCHYRNGADVADALRYAQLQMLRDKEPAMKWAPFQVVGYAGSPYARGTAMEKTHSEHLCSQNSFQRPDGLHSQ